MDLASVIGVTTFPLKVNTLVGTTEQEVPFHIWDISGCLRYFSLMDSYCKETDGCLLAFDVTKKVNTVIKYPAPSFNIQRNRVPLMNWKLLG